MENQKWGQIYERVSRGAEDIQKKLQEGKLISQREAALVREKELYDRMERGGVIVAKKEHVEAAVTPVTTPVEQSVMPDEVHGENHSAEQTKTEKMMQDEVNDDNVVEEKNVPSAADDVINNEVDHDELPQDGEKQSVQEHDQVTDPSIQQEPQDPTVIQAVDQNDMVSAEKTSEEIERLERVRALAWHTIHKIEEYGMLNAETLDEGDKKFLSNTRRLWNEFVVHGTPNGNDGKEILKKSDIDGESCLWLLKKSGVRIERDKVVFVEPGGTREHGIIMDTSGKHGVTTENEGGSVFVDHHAPNSQRGTSSARFFYETLIDMGMLHREEYLDQYIDFVTRIDNFDIPQDQQDVIYGNYHKNLYGLGSMVDVDSLTALFEKGIDLTQPLPDTFLAQYSYTKKDGTEETLMKLSKRIEDQMKKAKSEIKALATDGFVLDTKNKYGKLLIDPKKVSLKGAVYNRVSGSNNSNQVSVFNTKNKKGEHEYGAYMIWSPEQNSYVVYTRNAMHFDTVLDREKEGFVVRGHMWMKPRSDEPMMMNMQAVLSRLIGDDINIPKYIEKALITNDLAKEIMREIAQGKEMKKADLRDKFSRAKIPIEKIFYILRNQNSALYGICKAKIKRETSRFDNDEQKANFLNAFKKNKGETFTKEQKADQRILEGIYLESICELRATVEAQKG